MNSVIILTVLTFDHKPIIIKENAKGKYNYKLTVNIFTLLRNCIKSHESTQS